MLTLLLRAQCERALKWRVGMIVHASFCGWFVHLKALYVYRPQRSCGQGYVFTRVCDSVHRGVCLSACWDTTPRKETLQKEAPPRKETHWHTVNERLVRILLECILVQGPFTQCSSGCGKGNIFLP